jgi:hypothetical protein
MQCAGVECCVSIIVSFSPTLNRHHLHRCHAFRSGGGHD